MVYRAIGLMSGSSLDGLDIVFAELEENRGTWQFNIQAANCYTYDEVWKQKLANAKNLSAAAYFLLHVEYGKYLAAAVNRFVEENDLQHRVQLVASHGHTVFHEPAQNVTTQLGCGATIAALTGINVVSDLRMIDVALGGQGAPIVPLGEKLLFPGFDFYLNIGGIANISFQQEKKCIAFDVCPANRVLNMLAQQTGKDFDEDGKLASSGQVITPLLNGLNALDYYKQAAPKSLSNNFGTDVILPLIQSFQLHVEDALATCTAHIAYQLQQAVKSVMLKYNTAQAYKLLLTGGGAFNKNLVQKINENFSPLNIEVVIAEDNIVLYKEALIMALLGILRWREENTVMASITGASRDSIGGAVWMGQEA